MDHKGERVAYTKTLVFLDLATLFKEVDTEYSRGLDSEPKRLGAKLPNGFQSRKSSGISPSCLSFHRTWWLVSEPAIASFHSL
jgi:hypothetical protein